MRKHIKSVLSAALSLILLLGLLSGCTAKPKQTELVVFAAASMKETLTEIQALYEKEHSDVKLVFNFDSSGTLKTQIQEGADCDLFISAAQKQMNQLDSSCDAEKNPDGLDFVLQGSRVDLLENQVCLVIAKDNPAGLNSFDDLKAALEAGSILMAIGNADVPVGQYTQKILTYMGLDEDALAKAGVLTYGTNVKEVTSQVSSGAVDCGIVYGTDAHSAGLTVADTATAEMCGQVIYPAAVMKGSSHAEAAQSFLDFLKTDACSDVFRSVGFKPLS